MYCLAEQPSRGFVCRNHIANASYRTACGHFSKKFLQLGSIKIWCKYSSKSSGTFLNLNNQTFAALQRVKGISLSSKKKNCHKDLDLRNCFIVCVFAHVNYVHKIIKKVLLRQKGFLFPFSASKRLPLNHSQWGYEES